MPTSGTNKAVRTTTLRSQYAPPMTPTKSMSSTSSSPPAQGMTITEPDIEITDILQQHRVSIQEDRQGTKKGRTGTKTDGYLTAKQDYVRYSALDGTSGNVYFRGALIPKDKKPWGYAVVTVKCVVYYLTHCLINAFQWRPGKKPWRNVKYDAQKVDWYVDHYAAAPSTNDDRQFVTTKPLTWNGSINNILNALRDLKSAQLVTAAGQAFYNNPSHPDRMNPLRDTTASIKEIQMIQMMVKTRVEKSRETQDFDYFSKSLTEGYGLAEHKKLILHYLYQPGYNNALFQMMQSHEFSECMRNEDVLSLRLTHMGLYNMDNPSSIGSIQASLVVQASVLGIDTKSNKAEVVCSLRAKDPVICPLFSIGHYFFYRWVVSNCPMPLDLMPAHTATTATTAAAAASSSSSSSSSSSCQHDQQTRHQHMATK